MHNFIVSHTSLNVLDSWAQVGDFIMEHVPHGIILLEGPLGAGKTTLVQYIAYKKGWQQTITSPTYSLIQVYREIKLVHGDLYRLKDPREIQVLGLDDFSDSLVVLEWGASFQNAIDDCVALVKIQPSEQTSDRTVTIEFL